MLRLQSPQTLKALLGLYKISQRAMARSCGMSASAVNALVNHGQVPKSGWDEIRDGIDIFLQSVGAASDETSPALRIIDAPEPIIANEDNNMIIRKQTLTPVARRHFKLTRDPFADPQDMDDVFLTPESRYVRETMYDAAVNGGFLAVVGDSGSGKSTLREELIERLRKDGDSVIVVEPYTLAMSENDKVGKPLRATHIAEAVICSVSPGASVPPSPEMRARRLHTILKESCKSGFRHCLIIEEAHDLHMQTLKALKRFWELKDGMRRLLSIILIGQTELKTKLSNTQSSVREVVQRCVVVDLKPIKQPGEFLAHRFGRAGLDLAAVFDADALEVLRQQLLVAPGLNTPGDYQGYPLAISNLATASINTAADLGFDLVTADVVRQVRP